MEGNEGGDQPAETGRGGYSRLSDFKYKVIATVVTGLEYVAAAEIRRTISERCADLGVSLENDPIISVEKQGGRVVFGLPSGGRLDEVPWAEVLAEFWTLENLYILADRRNLGHFLSESEYGKMRGREAAAQRAASNGGAARETGGADGLDIPPSGPEYGPVAAGPSAAVQPTSEANEPVCVPVKDSPKKRRLPQRPSRRGGARPSARSVAADMAAVTVADATTSQIRLEPHEPPPQPLPHTAPNGQRPSHPHQHLDSSPPELLQPDPSEAQEPGAGADDQATAAQSLPHTTPDNHRSSHVCAHLDSTAPDLLQPDPLEAQEAGAGGGDDQATAVHIHSPPMIVAPTPPEQSADTQQALVVIRDAASSIFASQQFEDAVVTWLRLMGKDAKRPNGHMVLKFHVAPRRGGHHPITSLQVAATFAVAMHQRTCPLDVTWEAVLTGEDVEVLTHLSWDVITVALSITKKSLSLTRMSVPERIYTSTSLRPSIAYGLYHLAEVADGDLIVDPFAGTGTLPITCGLHHKAVFAIAADIALHAAQKSEHNVRMFTRRDGSAVANVEVARMDATQLPLRSNTVDVIISNMPFGKQIGNHSHNKRVLYPGFFAEMARVLRPGGRAVLLTLEKSIVLAEVGKNKRSIQCNKFHSINMGGLKVHVFCISKKLPKEKERTRAARHTTTGPAKAEPSSPPEPDPS